MSIRLRTLAFVGVVLLSGCSSQAAPSSTVAPSATTSVTTAPTPTSSGSTPTLERQAFDEVIAFVESLSSTDQFSGAALIGCGDHVVWEYAHGLADRARALPNRADTKFNLGSMNKMFTAVAILQLMEQGRLALDDTIATHLPDYPNTDVAAAVSIHHLLTHTSGLGDAFTPQFVANPNQYRSNTDFLPLFVDQTPALEPGDEFRYSNAGFVVLGLIIEKVSGEDYYDYVRNHIFEPSGMVDTDSYGVDEDVPNLAIGYTTKGFDGYDTGVLAANTALMPGRGFAAGGGYSTVGDLFRFQDALFDHRLLTAESTDLLTTGKVEIAEDAQYAYGFMDRIDGGRRVVGHTGGAPGICSFLSVYTEVDYTVIVLSNADTDCRQVLDYLRSNPPR